VLKNGDWEVKLQVNGEEIPLNPFVRSMVVSIILGMISPLKRLPEKPTSIMVKLWRLEK